MTRITSSVKAQREHPAQLAQIQAQPFPLWTSRCLGNPARPSEPRRNAISAHQDRRHQPTTEKGVCWDHGLSRIRLVDVFEGDLLTIDGIDGEDVESRLSVGSKVGAWRREAPEARRSRRTPTSACWTPTAMSSGPRPRAVRAGQRMNDGVRQARQVLLRLDSPRCASGAGQSLEAGPGPRGLPGLDRLRIPNGLVWSGDGSLAFHVDTPRGSIDDRFVARQG